MTQREVEPVPLSRPDDNPYAAPEALTSLRPARARTGDLRWHLAWLAVFGVNLIVPLLIGWEATDHGGRLGMFLSVVLMLVVGHLAFDRYPKIRLPLVAGGVWIGLTQFVPVPQILAGMLGFKITSLMLRIPLGGESLQLIEMTEPAGFVLTLLTGAQLLIAAALGGQVVLTIMRSLGWLNDGGAGPSAR